MRYIAIDIGASSGRHIYAEYKDGKLLTQEIYRFPNGPKRGEDGHLYWDVNSLFANIIAGLKEAKRLNKAPDYIGIDTWGVDYLLFSHSPRLPGKAYCYRDERTLSIVDEVHDKISFASLYEKTGIQYQPFNTIYQLYCDLKSGALGKAKRLLMLPDALNFALTGLEAQEYTNATTTGLVNCQTHQWDMDIIETLGFPKELFGPLTMPGHVLGPLKDEVANEVGFQAEVVNVASHDTASAVLAAPIEDGSPYISSGTWSLLGLESPIPHNDKESREYNYSNEGSLNGSFRYQKNIMGLWIIQQVRKELGDIYSFAELAELAREKKSPFVFDVDDPLFLAPESMLNAIQNRIGEATIGEISYAVYHSLALSYKKAIGELSRLTGRKFEKLHIIGGGGNNALLNELTAKESGLQVVVGPIEATAIGNILAQSLASEEVANLNEGRRIIRQSFSIKEE